MDEDPIRYTQNADRVRWRKLLVICVGVLMIVIDSTIVNVALPSIRADLRFSDDSLVWVVNAYLVPFGGFLPLGGRLGDHYGHSRLFLLGTMIFVFASLACGLASTAGVLIGARVIQGIGAAVVSAASLPLILKHFPESSDRVRALAILSSVCACGGSVGLLVGGILASGLNWHWIFLVNIPVGAFVCALYPVWRSQADRGQARGDLDIGGALMITTSLMLATYAVLTAAKLGWRSANVILPLSGAVVSGVLLVSLESRARAPMFPARLLRNRNLATGIAIGMLWTTAQGAWSFLSALYLQLVLDYTPLQIGLAFLPSTIIMAAYSLGIPTRFVTRFGVGLPVGLGMLLVAAGLALFAHAPVDAHFTSDVLPGMILLGLGCGSAYGPLIIGTLSEVDAADYGTASGVVSSVTVVGGAFALAVLAAVAASRTRLLLSAGVDFPDALNGGCHLAFTIGVLFACSAASLGVFMLRSETSLTDTTKINVVKPALGAETRSSGSTENVRN